MKAYLKKIPLKLKQIIRQAAQVSRETRMPAYLVGGCLRDLMLQVDNFDLDITVEGNGIIFAQHLAEKLKANLKIYPRFGTATLILANNLKVDIATSRQEEYPHQAALPVVRPGTLKEDLKRRDFTINAMALSLTSEKLQAIIDPFDAGADLLAGRIRVLHNLSFQDDPTRILRGIRFAQRFDFKIEPNTLALLKQAIAEGLLDKVNSHRLRDELILILKEPDPFKSIKQLSELGGLSFVSDKLKIGKSSFSLFKAVTQEIAWFNKNFPQDEQLDRWLVYFMALSEPLTLVQVKKIICRLGLAKIDQKRIISFFQERQKLVAVLSKKELLPDKIFLLLKPLNYGTIILLRAISKNKNLKKYLADFFKIYHGVRLCISGDDLRSLGVLPGPEFQRILAKVLIAKLNGQVKNRQTELALIKKLVQKT